jgi:hypothetical protein
MAETIISSHAGYDAKNGFVNGYLARPAVSERRPGDTTPWEEVEDFKKTLERYGKKHEIVFYQGMGHGFVDSPLLKDSQERRKAAAESLNRTYKFFRRELSPKTPPRNVAPRQQKKKLKRARVREAGA